MINREILYERNLTGSYMKIPTSLNATFDERIMLKRKLPGLLSVEKCFINSKGQYWYNITGKQSLDTYCRMKEIGIDFIEKMIISICSQIEILEWNLIHTNCLKLDPELVYITNQTQEIIFTLYPDDKGDLALELQQLMEYLLTKIDHKDMEAVHTAYGIYEKTLDPAYSVMDIRDAIVEAKNISARERVQKQQAELEQRERDIQREVESGNGYAYLGKEGEEKNLFSIFQSKEGVKDRGAKNRKAKQKKERVRPFGQRNNSKSYMQKPSSLFGNQARRQEGGIKYGVTSHRDYDFVAESSSYEVSMHEELPQELPEVHPTVCLSNYVAKPQGLLLYEGTENLESIRLDQETFRIGQGKDVDAQIPKGTISHFHAQIQKEKEDYYLEDLNSTNGTFLNGEGLTYREKRRLAMNDIVQFADVRYRFV